MVARLKTPASEQQIDEIRRLLELGVPKVRVAKQCGISIRTLYRHLSTLTSKPDSVSGKFSMRVEKNVGKSYQSWSVITLQPCSHHLKMINLIGVNYENCSPEL